MGTSSTNHADIDSGEATGQGSGDERLRSTGCGAIAARAGNTSPWKLLGWRLIGLTDGKRGRRGGGLEFLGDPKTELSSHGTKAFDEALRLVIDEGYTAKERRDCDDSTGEKDGAQTLVRGGVRYCDWDEGTTSSAATLSGVPVALAVDTTAIFRGRVWAAETVLGGGRCCSNIRITARSSSERPHLSSPTARALGPSIVTVVANIVRNFRRPIYSIAAIDLFVILGLLARDKRDRECPKDTKMKMLGANMSNGMPSNGHNPPLVRNASVFQKQRIKIRNECIAANGTRAGQSLNVRDHSEKIAGKGGDAQRRTGSTKHVFPSSKSFAVFVFGPRGVGVVYRALALEGAGGRVDEGIYTVIGEGERSRRLEGIKAKRTREEQAT
ncbi:hypothetical protein B0H16DRAFT_1483852 [Mycena metata]|uniref:Uncharacterized protein n=1 Tax=Mycena metata TaxID=1033252 RepID=A0AAD7DY00_9AGAR|nr:hypothetical protein B0H16DRAFT_1483852 [Mycena metata]